MALNGTREFRRSRSTFGTNCLLNFGEVCKCLFTPGFKFACPLFKTLQLSESL